MTMVAKDRLEVMVVGTRRFFIPIVAIDVGFDEAGIPRRTRAAFVIGATREAGGKLLPFQIEQPRMHDRVAQIAYPLTAPE